MLRTKHWYLGRVPCACVNEAIYLLCVCVCVCVHVRAPPVHALYVSWLLSMGLHWNNPCVCVSVYVDRCLYLCLRASGHEQVCMCVYAHTSLASDGPRLRLPVCAQKNPLLTFYTIAPAFQATPEFCLFAAIVLWFLFCFICFVFVCFGFH